MLCMFSLVRRTFSKRKLAAFFFIRHVALMFIVMVLDSCVCVCVCVIFHGRHKAARLGRARLVLVAYTSCFC